VSFCKGSLTFNLNLPSVGSPSATSPSPLSLKAVSAVNLASFSIHAFSSLVLRIRSFSSCLCECAPPPLDVAAPSLLGRCEPDLFLRLLSPEFLSLLLLFSNLLFPRVFSLHPSKWFPVYGARHIAVASVAGSPDPSLAHLWFTSVPVPLLLMI
jgi:hypothetical protein